MLANRTFGLLALCLLILPTTAAIGLPAAPSLPVAVPSTPEASGIPATAGADVEGEVAGGVATATGALTLADPGLTKAEELLAQAHAKAQIAARRAHAAENARDRFFRLADHAIANANAEAGAAQASPEAVPERLLVQFAFMADRALTESNSAREAALSLATRAQALAGERRAEIEATAADPSGAQAKLVAIADRLQARADARVEAAQHPEVVAQAIMGRAQTAVAEWTDRVEILRAEATADPASLAFAEARLADAEARLELATAHADALAQRAETGGHDALNDPFGSPFRMLERMKPNTASAFDAAANVKVS